VRKFAEFSGGQIDCRTFLSADEIKEFYRHGNQIVRELTKAALAFGQMMRTLGLKQGIRRLLMEKRKQS
jgi:hypothetical protein